MRKNEATVTFDMKDVITKMDSKMDCNAAKMDQKMDQLGIELKTLNMKLVDSVAETNKQLITLNANMSTAMSKITEHEARISHLEQDKRTVPAENKFNAGKDALIQCIPFLVKSLMIAILTIAVLSGGGDVILKIFGR